MMEYVNLGKSGLKVSRLCLGCMSYGVPERGAHPWTLDEEQSRPFFQRALDLGITFFDTSSSYSDGTSEEITGRALRDFARRDEIVIATKVFFPLRKDPNGRGLSRKAILTEIDASLRRLGTDYVDLYQIHRWDYATPFEETLEALHDVVKAGKARYLGASSMIAWQLCKALYLADRQGWTRFVSMQDHYNLLYREEKREMLGLCQAEGIGVLPWSPLARGRLTRPWEEQPGTKRAETDEYGKKLYKGAEEADRKVVERVGELAASRGCRGPVAGLGLCCNDGWVAAPQPGVLLSDHPHQSQSRIRLSQEACYATPRPVCGLQVQAQNLGGVPVPGSRTDGLPCGPVGQGIAEQAHDVGRQGLHGRPAILGVARGDGGGRRVAVQGEGFRREHGQPIPQVKGDRGMA